VARMGEETKVYRVLVGKPEGKRPLGRPRCRWEDGFIMVLREIGWIWRHGVSYSDSEEVLVRDPPTPCSFADISWHPVCLSLMSEQSLRDCRSLYGVSNQLCCISFVEVKEKNVLVPAAACCPIRQTRRTFYMSIIRSSTACQVSEAADKLILQ
jgi:hypothetical protein